MENYKTVTPKSSPDRFREVVVYTSFQQYGFDWENFVVLDIWSLGGGNRQRDEDTHAGSTVFHASNCPENKKLYKTLLEACYREQ